MRGGSKIRRLRNTPPPLRPRRDTPPPLKSKKSVVKGKLGKSKKEHRVRAIAKQQQANLRTSKQNPGTKAPTPLSKTKKIKRSSLARGWKGPKHQGGWTRGASMGPKLAQMRRQRQKKLGMKANPTTVNLW
tara:strand:+ start:647 stop:1039 length:393 start_codon:yes stop_codon:yes gene_type:complete